MCCVDSVMYFSVIVRSRTLLVEWNPLQLVISVSSSTLLIFLPNFVSHILLVVLDVDLIQQLPSFVLFLFHKWVLLLLLFSFWCPFPTYYFVQQIITCWENIFNNFCLSSFVLQFLNFIVVILSSSRLFLQSYLFYNPLSHSLNIHS